MAINDVVQCRAVYWWDEQLCINSFFYVLRGPTFTPSDVNDQVAGTIMSKWTLAAGPACQLLRLEAQRISPGPRTFVVEKQANSPGLVPGPTVPTSCSVVIRKRTANAGKAFRGRWYFPGLSASHVTNSVVNAAGLALWGDVAATCFAQISIVGGEVADPVLIAYRGNNVWSNGLVLTSCTVDNVIRNQRRRQVGRGV